ncbi:hypothetical protein HON01_10435 [Candidatus Woesearchaeota archaeon]|nr:hypothetical protein [Candidatus Woesearchaeota archaeon]
MNEKNQYQKHIILDSDIGCDPDDLFALMFAINSPEVSLDLVTTCDEWKGYRANFTRELFKNLNNSTPVVKGTTLNNPRYCTIDNLVPEQNQDDDYLGAMADIIKSNNHTTIACIGPQTNIANFLTKYPELINKVDVLMMGGAINYRNKNKAEHNVRMDTSSAIKVFNSLVQKKYVLSDTTFNMKLAVDKDHKLYKKISENPKIGELAKQSIDNFFNNFYPASLMHDPLTLAALIRPDLIDFKTEKLVMADSGIMSLSNSGINTVVSSNAKYDDFMEFLYPRI